MTTLSGRFNMILWMRNQMPTRIYSPYQARLNSSFRILGHELLQEAVYMSAA